MAADQACGCAKGPEGISLVGQPGLRHLQNVRDRTSNPAPTAPDEPLEQIEAMIVRLTVGGLHTERGSDVLRGCR